MRWKSLFAVLLGLLVIGTGPGGRDVVTAKSSGQLNGPTDVIGVGPPYERWVITSVSGFYTTYGPWKTCISGYGDPPDSLTCSFTGGYSYTWHNAWSGSLEVGVYELNSAVGFSVTAFGSVERSATYHYRYPGQHLIIQYRDVYNTKTVIQTKYCISHLGIERECGIATVYAKKWSHVEFRAVDGGVIWRR